MDTESGSYVWAYEEESFLHDKEEVILKTIGLGIEKRVSVHRAGSEEAEISYAEYRAFIREWS